MADSLTNASPDVFASGDFSQEATSGVLTDAERYAKCVAAFCGPLTQGSGFSAHTMRNYRLDLEDFGRWAQRHSVDPLSVSPTQIRAYLTELEKAHYSRSTVNRRLASLKTFFRRLMLCGLVDYDPVNLVSGPSEEDVSRPSLELVDVVKLLSVHREGDTPSDARDQAILEFIYACGARISEVSNLETKQVNFDTKQVRVVVRGGKERIIPLHGLAIASMRAYLHHARPELLKGKSSPYFFVSSRGNQMGADALRKMFKKTVMLAGLNPALTPQDLRQAFADAMARGGQDFQTVQDMLDQSGLTSTQVYTHVSVARLKETHRGSSF